MSTPSSVRSPLDVVSSGSGPGPDVFSRRRDRVAKRVGADGLLVETHPNPSEAWCDADQALTPDELLALMVSVRAVAGAIGRSV